MDAKHLLTTKEEKHYEDIMWRKLKRRLPEINVMNTPDFFCFERPQSKLADQCKKYEETLSLKTLF